MPSDTTHFSPSPARPRKGGPSSRMHPVSMDTRPSNDDSDQAATEPYHLTTRPSNTDSQACLSTCPSGVSDGMASFSLLFGRPSNAAMTLPNFADPDPVPYMPVPQLSKATSGSELRLHQAASPQHQPSAAAAAAPQDSDLFSDREQSLILSNSMCCSTVQYGGTLAIPIGSTTPVATAKSRPANAYREQARRLDGAAPPSATLLQFGSSVTAAAATQYSGSGTAAGSCAALYGSSNMTISSGGDSLPDEYKAYIDRAVAGGSVDGGGLSYNNLESLIGSFSGLLPLHGSFSSGAPFHDASNNSSLVFSEVYQSAARAYALEASDRNLRESGAVAAAAGHPLTVGGTGPHHSYGLPPLAPPASRPSRRTRGTEDMQPESCESPVMGSSSCSSSADGDDSGDNTAADVPYVFTPPLSAPPYRTAATSSAVRQYHCEAASRATDTVTGLVRKMLPSYGVSLEPPAAPAVQFEELCREEPSASNNIGPGGELLLDEYQPLVSSKRKAEDQVFPEDVGRWAPDSPADRQARKASLSLQHIVGHPASGASTPTTTGPAAAKSPLSHLTSRRYVDGTAADVIAAGGTFLHVQAGGGSVRAKAHSEIVLGKGGERGSAFGSGGGGKDEASPRGGRSKSISGSWFHATIGRCFSS